MDLEKLKKQESALIQAQLNAESMTEYEHYERELIGVRFKIKSAQPKYEVNPKYWDKNGNAIIGENELPPVEWLGGDYYKWD